jgi:hypothetical protein
VIITKNSLVRKSSESRPRFGRSTDISAPLSGLGESPWCQIFDFYVNKDWPPEEVAAKFGVSVEQVYTAKSRITELIRKEAERLKKEMN